MCQQVWLAVGGSVSGPKRRIAILIGPLGTKFSKVLIGIQTFLFIKLHWNTSSAKWRVFCLGLGWVNVSIRTIFSCDQAAIWLVQSVRPSVRPSVCPSVRPSVTPFSPCSHHRIIMKFSGVITMVRSDVHAKGQGQRSTVKVTEVNTQLSRFRTLTPVWIHIWQWNHAHRWK